MRPFLPHARVPGLALFREELFDELRHQFIAVIRFPAQAAQEPPDAYEGERKAYDEIYSTKRDIFNSNPNAFMVRMITGRKPGRALGTC